MPIAVMAAGRVAQHCATKSGRLNGNGYYMCAIVVCECKRNARDELPNNLLRPLLCAVLVDS